MAVAAQRLRIGIAIDAFDGLLARRVYRRDHRDIGIVQAGAELLERIAQARVAVRLHDGDDGAGIRLTRGFQRGGDLERVVAVIVDDGGAIPFADAGEAAADAAEIVERLADLLVAHAKLARDGDRRQRVLHIVLARHGQAHILEARFRGLRGGR